MKRIIASLMVLMLLLSFASCGGEQTIIGEWQATLDLSEYMDGQVEDAEIKKYIKIDDFNLVYYFTFREDGTYEAKIDDAKAVETYNSAKEIFKKGARDYLQAQIDLAGGGTTVDDLLALSGTSLDALVEQIFSKEAVDEVAKAMALEGEYKIEGEKLFLTASAAPEFSEDRYCTFKLKGDKLTIEEGTSNFVANEDFEIFPLNLKRESK